MYDVYCCYIMYDHALMYVVDVVAGRIDPWRIMMALKSGQLMESTWALDALSVLLFDDHTVVYFGLQHLPGLLDVLLEHFRRLELRYREHIKSKKIQKNIYIYTVMQLSCTA